MDIPPSKEQQAIIDAALAMVSDPESKGGSLKVLAGAGSGKTFTLIRMASAVMEKYPGAKILYLAYNREIKLEAAEKFGSLAETFTTHGLAYKMLGIGKLGRKVGTIHRGMLRDILGRSLSDIDLLLVQRSFSTFCESAPTWPTEDLVPTYLNGTKVTKAKQIETVGNLERLILKVAPDNRDSEYPIPHGLYCKAWQMMGSPGLEKYDLVCMDEAQDSSPVILSALEGAGRSAYVGDSNQAIYEWRSAVDALQTVYGTAYPMTQSYRFGHTIADIANTILSCKHVKPTFQLIGSHVIDSYIGVVDRRSVHARVYRTNRTLIRESMILFDRGIPFAVAGNSDEICSMISSVWALRNNNARGVKHPLVRYLKTWDAALKAAEAGGDGPELNQAVWIVEEFQDRVPDVIRILSEFKDEDSARIVMTTAHRSKGREWDNVVLSEDFDPVIERSKTRKNLWDAEMNLLYVASTRARHCLEIQCRWLNGALRQVGLVA